MVINNRRTCPAAAAVDSVTARSGRVGQFICTSGMYRVEQVYQLPRILHLHLILRSYPKVPSAAAPIRQRSPANFLKLDV
jgi:hypothetical protein